MQQLSLYWFEGLDELVDRPGWGSEEGLMHLENGSRPAVTPHVKTLRVMTCCFFCKVYSRLKAFSHFSSFLSSWEWIKFRSGARQHIMFKTWPHRANDLYFPYMETYELQSIHSHPGMTGLTLEWLKSHSWVIPHETRQGWRGSHPCHSSTSSVIPMSFWYRMTAEWRKSHSRVKAVA